ncbi:glycosyltransferase [Autumnicola psychrophila]|uniref:Glycosyltransferase n=1 Tax=Autumnicola psychrophila TaxID=3075592 RepID=A0ABU3DWM3_9FLAO|nr:glycosyltransferase [Zunongwangia sp. F225]MDT0688117.1 glycosyltransferase [Zunongwangia sp. F225]
MPLPEHLEQQLVSVIIPCYNHAKYLAHAINSVYVQSYRFFEVIIVDDGSVDNTKVVCATFPDVRYVYQENSGLSAARNTGIKHAKGEYLVFLDADDWLLENALERNISYLKSDPRAAFVAGGYQLYYEPEDKIWIIQQEITKDYYRELLVRNFIGMHATVMYQHWVFKKFSFNTSLRYCEDYDIYLQITRLFPIIYHTHLIAVYRKHHDNMSANYSGMMDYALRVLSFQKKNLKNKAERECYKKGKNYWTTYYSRKVYDNLIGKLYAGEVTFEREEIKTLKKYDKHLYKKFRNQPFEDYEGKRKNFKKICMNVLRKIFGKIKKKPTIPRVKKINLGDFDRTSPFSTQFGYDRGGPLDRYYIENFLKAYSSQIKGRVLEIGDNSYTLEFGGDAVIKSDVLHIDESNLQATYIGDLSNVPHIPSDSFDCIVLTQTLNLIYDFKAAIATCYRILKTGGTLLITVPGISQVAQDGWGKYWLWSFTDASMQRLMEEYFPSKNISVKTYGNVMVASAFLYGMGLPEINKKNIDAHDPHYQLIVSVSAVK